MPSMTRPVREGRSYTSDWIDVGSPPFRRFDKLTANRLKAPSMSRGLPADHISDGPAASLRQGSGPAQQAPALHTIG